MDGKTVDGKTCGGTGGLAAGKAAKRALAAAVAFAAWCGCGTETPVRHIPADIRTADAPAMLGHETFTLGKDDGDFIAELSGLCLSRDGDFLWGAGDDGKLYRINFDGTYSLHAEFDADLEGLALDPATGDLYACAEPDEVYRLRPPYKKAGLAFKIEGAKEMRNSGLEGIAWADGALYAGAQTGATLWRCSPSGRTIEKKSLRKVEPTISEIAGMCFERDSGRLWAVDSNSNRKRPQYLPYRLYLFDADATKLLASYPLTPFATVNPEAVCADKARGCVWVGEDRGDGKASLLHKIKFSGL